MNRRKTNLGRNPILLIATRGKLTDWPTYRTNCLLQNRTKKSEPQRMHPQNSQHQNS